MKAGCITAHSIAKKTEIEYASLWRFLNGKQSLSGDSVFRLLDYLQADIRLPEGKEQAHAVQ